MKKETPETPVAPTVAGKTVPESIHIKILELKELETRLGHLPTESFAVSDLQKRYTDPSQMNHSSQMEQRTQALFRDISGELHDCGWLPTEIAEAINQIVRYEGGPKYCNADEVTEVLG